MTLWDKELDNFKNIYIFEKHHVSNNEKLS